MKKGIKSLAAAALALSALTPVVASASTSVENGVYTTTNFYTLDQFKALTTAEKTGALTSSGAVVVIGGKVYEATDVLSATDAALPGLAKDAATYTTADGNKLESGKPLAPAPAGELKVESVSAINDRQIEVKFSTPLSKASVKETNFYLSLIKGDALADNSISSLNTKNSTAFKTVLSKDGKTVTITSDAGEDLADLNLKENERFYVTVRNVQDTEGNYSDVQEVSSIWKDTVKPSVVINNEDAFVNETDKTLSLGFSEPIDLDAFLETAKIYVNSVEVKVEDASALAAGLSGLSNATTVAAHSTLAIEFGVVEDINGNVIDLTDGKNEISIVGAKDLAGNLISPNLTTLSFTYGEKEEDAKPAVKEIVQVADNAFKVVFTTAGVTPSSGNVVTFKEATYDSGTSTYGDIIIADTEVGTIAAYNKITSTEVTDANGKVTHTEWLVVVDAVETDSTTKLSYRGANVISKTIIVENYENTAGTGKKTEKKVNFSKDLTAPVIADTTKDITVEDDSIYVKFTDGQFKTDGNGQVILGTKDAKISYTSPEGITFTETIAVADLEVGEFTGGVFGTTKADLNNDDAGTVVKMTVTNPDMLKSSKLISGGTYTIELGNGFVIDAQEKLVTSVGYLNVKNTNPFVARTVSVKVPGTGIDGVPQTTVGMIFSAAELASAGSGSALIDTVKTEAVLNLEANQIAVLFEGDLDAATVRNASNYTINGKTVAAYGGSVVYRSENIDGVNGNEKFAVITLPKDAIALNGQYDFKVENIANTKGNKMLAVSDKVSLTDNTAPVLKAVKVENSNTLKLTFNELVAVDTSIVTAAQISKNFKVVVDNVEYQVNSADVQTDAREVLLTVAGNFDNNGSLNVNAKVSVKLDQNGDMFLTDASTAKNAAKVMELSNK